MSFLQGALTMGRAMSNARMTETIVAGVFADGTDETTGDATKVLVLERYAGPARIKDISLTITDRSEPSQVIAAQEPELSIPTGSVALRLGDEVRITASTADTRVVGRTYVVGGLPQAGQTTAHRYPLKALS